MEELRREITQYQASLIDLMKMEAYYNRKHRCGRVGINKGCIGEDSRDYLSNSLCGPLACNYVDALCKNLQLKIYRRRLSMVQIGDEIGGNAKENIAARFEFGEAHYIKEDGPIS